MRILNRTGNDQAAVGGIQPAEHHFRLDIRMLLKAHFILALQHMASLGEPLINIAFNRMMMRGNIVAALRMDQPGTGCQRLLNIGERRIGRIADVYFVSGLAGGLIGGRRDHSNHVAVKDHLIFDDRQVIFHDNPHRWRTRNILPGGNFHHAVDRQRIAQIKVFNFARRDIRIAADTK